MIQVSHLKKTYSNGLQVLRDVNATIEKGEVISIIGPSGTGKSTFLRCLNLLEKPTGGSIIIDGQDLLSKGTDVPKLRQKMGMVFQSFNLFNHLSIMDNLCIGPVKLLGKSRKEAEIRAMELLAMVGLAEKANVMPSQLSCGQKQRIAIARALINNPAVLFADEPSGNLDSKTKGELHKLFFDLRDKYGQTIIIVTHDPDLAKMCDRELFMIDGQFV